MNATDQSFIDKRIYSIPVPDKAQAKDLSGVKGSSAAEGDRSKLTPYGPVMGIVAHRTDFRVTQFTVIASFSIPYVPISSVFETQMRERIAIILSITCRYITRGVLLYEEGILWGLSKHDGKYRIILHQSIFNSWTFF